jgi:nucleolar protein 6
MSSAQLPKLTKKQKKGIAFRERKQGKSKKDKNDQPDGEGGGQDVPIQEAIHQAEIQDDDVEMKREGSTKKSEEMISKADGKGKSKGVAVRGDTEMVGRPKKRKWEEREAHDGEKPKPKKLKGGSEDNAKVEKETNIQGKQRFILFLGTYGFIY